MPEHQETLRLDTPTSARLASLMLGGKDHLAADRALLTLLMAEDPHCVPVAGQSRAFLHLAARSLAEQGQEQFLDLGCGLTTEATGTLLAPIHTSVLGARPTARTVYVDNDPMVMAHARALPHPPAPAMIRHVRADLTAPKDLLAAVRADGDLDWRRPVTVILGDVLHELTDPQTRLLLGSLSRVLPIGSVLVLSHRTADGTDPRLTARVAAHYARSGLPWYPRGRQTVNSLLDGWGRRAPEIAAPHTRPSADAADTPGVYTVVAVAGDRLAG
ncbi:SAM-dependent methyltransferase [Kitasatospora sp. NPDC059327]|uniref:SAM-dependent methyltransferase n=1 Tax=Kitasatospora sp. NPDC059327 TaxID=3346803 RepID=UPI003680C48C